MNAKKFRKVVEHLKLSLVPVSSIDHSLKQGVNVSVAHRVLLAVQGAHHIDIVDGWNGRWQTASGLLQFLVDIHHLLHNGSQINIVTESLVAILVTFTPQKCFSNVVLTSA